MSRTLIAPSILSADFGKLHEEIKLIEQEADILHIDIMDGHYVPNLTIGPAIIKSLRLHSQLFFETHLMITNAEDSVQQYIDAGSDRIVVHPETITHLHRLLVLIKSQGKQAGLALNPGQPLEILALPYIGNLLDSITVMTVNPGFPAQSFIPESITKIKDLKQLINNLDLNIQIQVDGGINKQTAPLVKQAGANILVAGNAVYNTPDPVQAIRELREI